MAEGPSKKSIEGPPTVTWDHKTVQAEPRLTKDVPEPPRPKSKSYSEQKKHAKRLKTQFILTPRVKKWVKRRQKRAFTGQLS